MSLTLIKATENDDIPVYMAGNDDLKHMNAFVCKGLILHYLLQFFDARLIVVYGQK